MVENRPKGQVLLCGGEGKKMRDNWGKSTGKPPEGSLGTEQYSVGIECQWSQGQVTCRATKVIETRNFVQVVNCIIVVRLYQETAQEHRELNYIVGKIPDSMTLNHEPLVMNLIPEENSSLPFSQNVVWSNKLHTGECIHTGFQQRKELKGPQSMFAVGSQQIVWPMFLKMPSSPIRVLL